MPSTPEQSALDFGRIVILTAIFFIALLPRLYSAQTVGTGWFGTDSFTVINFDEVNACRAWLKADVGYFPLLGAQTVGLATMLGYPAPLDAVGNYAKAKAYCLDRKHMVPARTLSAVLGAMTVVVLGVIALVLSPGNPQIAWTASLLLALSGFHATQSHMATVDVALTFYLYLFSLCLMIAVSRQRLAPLLFSFALVLPAMFAKKFWPFPLFAYLALLPEKVWRWLIGEMTTRHLITLFIAALVMAALAFNTGFQATGWYPLLTLFYLSVPWRKVNRWTIPFLLALPWLTWGITLIEFTFIQEFTSGHQRGKFGSGFGAIGWNKIPRNLLNVPVLIIVGISLPAAVLIPWGIKNMIRDKKNVRLWLCFLPVLFWALYLLLIAPRTTYRHYLPLIPLAALLAAFGLYSLSLARNRLFIFVFFLWQTLLLIDFQLDFHQDPRKAAVAWYREHPGARIFFTYYVSPPPDLQPAPILFKTDYASGDAKILKQGHFLVISENWYETAQRHELNGPLIGNPKRLVKTTPKDVAFYRQVLAGNHPHLKLEQEFNVRNFMPELALHKRWYGTFQKFVGDLKIYRIISQG